MWKQTYKNKEYEEKKINGDEEIRCKPDPSKTKGMKFDAFYVSMLSEEHMSGKKNFIKSIFVGIISNMYGLFGKGGFSSSIYVFERSK